MKKEINDNIDIKETDLYKEYPEAFMALLRDNTRFRLFKELHKEMSKEELSKHDFDPENLIIWATDDYASLGEGYSFHDPITVDKITGENGLVIRPRCKKPIEEKTRRVKDKAEVFTPSWVCNAQNNLIDEAWFGRKNVFNREVINEDGTRGWVTNYDSIKVFPEGKTWKDYVCDTRMEITCGEAPYLASRYDTTTGQYIEVKDRIGLIDRKLRIISENVDEPEKWINAAIDAYENTYGFEWQGDNLLLARESLLISFIEHIVSKFGPTIVKRKNFNRTVKSIGYRIAWNIWQMDGLKYVLPLSCGIKDTVINKEEIEKSRIDSIGSLFPYIPDEIIEPRPCEGCETGNVNKHNGIYAYIRNWQMYKNKKRRKDGTCDRDNSDQPFLNYINNNKLI